MCDYLFWSRLASCFLSTSKKFCPFGILCDVPPPESCQLHPKFTRWLRHTSGAPDSTASLGDGVALDLVVYRRILFECTVSSCSDLMRSHGHHTSDSITVLYNVSASFAKIAAAPDCACGCIVLTLLQIIPDLNCIEVAYRDMILFGGRSWRTLSWTCRFVALCSLVVPHVACRWCSLLSSVLCVALSWPPPAAALLATIATKV